MGSVNGKIKRLVSDKGFRVRGGAGRHGVLLPPVGVRRRSV